MKSKINKYGGIHGICVLVKNAYASNCSVVTEFMSESVLWLHISKPVIKYDFLLGAVYLPHEASTYYSDDVFKCLSDDRTTIRAKYDVPTILMGDFNARTGTTSDFEHIYGHDELFIDNDQYIIYFEKEDKHMHRNGKKLMEFYKMSDMKILNVRIGKDKSLGNFTCYTTRGSGTIDDAIASTELFPKFSDFYIDIMDSCMSDVHCHVCVLLSCTESYKKDTNLNNKNNSKYWLKTHAKTRRNQEHCEQYTLSFDMKHIKTLQDKFNTIIYDMTSTSENMIEQLYMEIKDVFIQPAKVTNMYNEIKESYNKKTKVDRRHGSHVWFNKHCEENACL